MNVCPTLLLAACRFRSSFAAGGSFRTARILPYSSSTESLASHSLLCGLKKSDDRHAKSFDFGCHIFTKTFRVCEFRARFVYACVNGAPEMFQKRAEQAAIEVGPMSIGTDDCPCRAGRRQVADTG